MSIPRPKILTRVTVPSGGWTWDIDVSDVAQYDTNLTSTVAAGDYYISGDNQSDDLLFALTTSIKADIVANGLSGTAMIWIDPDTHKASIQVYGTDFVDATGDNDVRINFSSWSAGLCAALGYDTSDVAKTTEDNPTFEADWHHGYGWYADEDGQGDIMPVDRSMAYSIQGKSISGKVKTQFFGESFASELRLEFLERNSSGRTKVFSNGVGYGTASVWPYNRNEPLECWWEEARKGIEFRVYRDGYINTSRAASTGTSTAASVTTITDAGKSWSTDPSRWVGCIKYSPVFIENPQSFYISANTATQLTVPNAHPSGIDADGGALGLGGQTYYIFDHPYQTYVVDLKEMSEFAPREHAAIDRWNITIPLLRYV